MAITKVTGHVIDPITNITSHNINSSGIITATRFDGPIGAGLTDGNFSGIITATQLNVTGVGTFNGIGVTSLNVSGVSTFRNNVQLLDNDKLQFGDSTTPDLEIYHDSNESFIKDAGTGMLKILTSTVNIKNASDNSLSATFIPATGVSLFYSGSKKLETTNTGAVVTGILTVTGNMNVEGVLTYQDVTNIDSVGIITARTGIKVLAGGINAVGVVTATSFVGGLPITSGADNRVITASSASAIQGESNLTFDGSTLNLTGRLEADTITGPSGSAGNFSIASGHASTPFLFYVGQFGVSATEKLRITATGNLKLPDSAKIELGGAQTGAGDLSIYHDSTNSQIHNVTGTLRIRGDSVKINNAGASKNAIVCESNIVTLYYDNSARLATNDNGISVTGEVAASQDYPNFRPTLDFNFAAEKKLDPRIIYERTGPASFVNEFGKVVLIGDNAPRFDHDSDTRESKGLLIEESRTNLIYPSSNWSSTYWSLSAVTSEPNTTDTKDPAGTFNASKLIPINGNTALKDIHWASSSLTFTNGVKYAASVFAKSTTGLVLQLRPRGQGSNKAWVNYNLSTGTIGNYGGTTLLTKEIEKYPNGWYRCSLTFTGSGNSGAGYGTLIMDDDTDTEAVAHTGDSSKSMYLWGAQHEQGAFVTSYVPTLDGNVTRGPDDLVIDGSDFTDFINKPEGTIVADYKVIGGHPEIMYLSNDNSNCRIGLYEAGSSQTRFLVNNSGTLADTTDSAGTTVGDNIKSAGAYKLNDVAAAKNGVISSTDSSVTIPDGIDRAYIGGYYNGDVEGSLGLRRLVYYQQRLPNSQLVTLTA